MSGTNCEEAALRSRSEGQRGRSLVLELVGPAGAGKTTLSRTLCQRDPRMVAGLRVGKARQARLTLQHSAALLPTFLRRHRSDRWFNRAELRAMAYLAGWPEVLGRDAPEPRVTLLDHGPVFRLAVLREFGPALTRSGAFERHWSLELERWGALLDRVVWLDASDDVLMERIRQREQDHGVKEGSDEAVRAFLGRYRTRLEDVLGRLSKAGGPTALRFDTARQSSEQIAASVLSVLPGCPASGSGSRPSPGRGGRAEPRARA
jgi:shikimate kinase